MGFTGRCFGGALSILIPFLAGSFSSFKTAWNTVIGVEMKSKFVASLLIASSLFINLAACAAPDDYSIRLNNNAVRAINSKDYRSAISSLESVLKREPGYSIAITNLVTAYNCSYEQEPNADRVQKIIYLLKAYLLNPNSKTTQHNLSKAVNSVRETTSNSLGLARDDDEKKRLDELDTNLDLCTDIVPANTSSSLRRTFGDLYHLRGAQAKSVRQENIFRLEKEREDARAKADILQQNILQLKDLSKGVPPPLVRPASAPLEDSTPASNLQPAFDYNGYLSSCQSKIFSKWTHLNKVSDSRFVPCVTLKIDRQGGVVESKLTASSGSSIVDQAVLKAVEKAAPFKPLPEGANEFESFEFSFHGKRGR